MKRKHIALFLGAACLVLIGLHMSDSITAYVEGVKNGSLNRQAIFAARQDGQAEIDPAKLSEKDRLLYNEIAGKAKELYIAPVDARVDPVWRAIPGLNGRTVNIEKTFLWAKKTGNISYIFKEIPPKVLLNQLGPEPIFKGNPDKKMVSFMINVAWGNEHIPAILNTLAEENVRATFFLDGSWLQKNAEMARQIAEQGHEMANHAYSHKNMSRLSAGEAREEISKTQTLIKEILGADNILFAPPSGDFSKETVRIARDLNLYTILWTLDTLDWKNPHPDWIVRKITSRLEPGALILMHPTESSSKALPAMIKEAKRRGYVIGTVSDLLSPYRVPYVETEFIF